MHISKEEYLEELKNAMHVSRKFEY
jgi:hypothetical protein